MAFEQELQGQSRLADPRISLNQEQAAGREAAAEDVVQACYTRRRRCRRCLIAHHPRLWTQVAGVYPSRGVTIAAARAVLSWRKAQPCLPCGARCRARPMLL